jgi:hypothetical protein
MRNDIFALAALAAIVSVPAFAEEATKGSGKTDPVAMSDAEMDGVTAGAAAIGALKTLGSAQTLYPHPLDAQDPLIVPADLTKAAEESPQPVIRFTPR